jgi:outer membrane protein assembly factor BamA
MQGCRRKLRALALCATMGTAGGFVRTADALDVLPSIFARDTRTPLTPPLDVPSDAALEQAGARIGTITFDLQDIFATDTDAENTLIFRLANRLHGRTKTDTVAQQLLFRTGEPYARRLLDESERTLRGRRYLSEVVIRPIAVRDGVVDIEVRTRDVWTLSTGISFGRSGGQNTYGAKLEEINLFGRGIQLTSSFKSNVDRDTVELNYTDPHLLGTHWRLSTQYADNSDGRKSAFALEQPFYALDARQSMGLRLSDDKRDDPVYDLGKVVERYGVKQRSASAFAGWSGGLQSGWAQRWTAGVTYEDNLYTPPNQVEGPQFTPTSRTWVYPWLRYALLQDAYATRENLNQIGRTEDISLGWSFTAQLGVAASAFGADQSALIWSGSINKGAQLTERLLVDGEMAVAGRLEGSTLRNATLNASARSFWQQSPRALFYMNAQVATATRLDDDQRLTLGGDNGLRGYPLRYQSGTGRWLITAEQRYFSDWYPFRLMRVGAAAFVDVGQTWSTVPLASKPLGVLKDVGFGLRLGQSRSGLGNVTHIDVAFPLDARTGVSKVQFVVETKRSF